MKFSALMLVVLGVVAALCSILLVGLIRSGQPMSLGGSSEVTILVATKALPAVSVVSEDAVVEKRIARSSAPSGYLSDKAQVVGQVLMMPVVEGQSFTLECFNARGKGQAVASRLPEGMRAMSVSLTDHGGLEGLLYPGCIVDVLASFPLSSNSQSGGRAVSTPLLQGVQVLAIENQTLQSEKDEKAEDKRMSRPRQKLKVTLMVDPKQARALQLALEFGEISLVMRNPKDLSEADSEPTLLSEGRLAKLASVLGSQVAPSVPLPAPEPKVVSTPGATPTWDVSIVRGVEVEVKSFPMPQDAGG